MTIKRVEFLGFTVSGPRGSTRTHYKPADWPGWTAKAEGQAVILEGMGRKLEIPRIRCVIEWGKEEAAAPVVVRRGPGRPPKVQPPASAA